MFGASALLASRHGHASVGHATRHRHARVSMFGALTLPARKHDHASVGHATRRGRLSIVGALAGREAQLGLAREETFQKLKGRIDRSRDKLCALLTDLKRDGKRVVGYGATSKSTTVTNYCGIGADLVEFISDTTPTKQGKFSPGTHIPVKPHEAFASRYPDYALLFAWNHGEEIIENERNFLQQGGKFISFVPEVRILD